MARRYVNPNAPAPPLAVLEQEAGERFGIAPGMVSKDDLRALARLKAGTLRPDRPSGAAVSAAGGLPPRGRYDARAPGAVLDCFPWASSWSKFIAAIESDSSARAAIVNAAMSERIPSEGGALVPEHLRAEVMLYIEEAIVRPRSLVIPMDSLRVPLPVVDNTSEASNAGVLGGMTFAITEEGQAIPASSAGLSRVVLTARKLAGLLQKVPNELIDDGGAAFDSFAGPAVGRGFAWAEDDLYINGSGAGEPEGLISAACAVSVTRASSNAVSVADVAGMWTRLAAPSMQSGTAVWLCSPKVVGQLGQMYLTGVGQAWNGSALVAANMPVSVPEWLLGTAPDGGWRLAGLPLIVTSHLPDLGSPGDLCLADFSWFAVGDRQALTAERSAAGEGFISDESDLRFTARIDGRWLIRSPVTPSDGSQTTSPVVILH